MLKHPSTVHATSKVPAGSSSSTAESNPTQRPTLVSYNPFSQHSFSQLAPQEMPNTAVVPESRPSSVTNSSGPPSVSSSHGDVSVKKSPPLASPDGQRPQAPAQGVANGLSPPPGEGLPKPAPAAAEQRASMKDKLTRMFSKDTPKSTPSVTSNPSPRRSSFDEESHKSSSVANKKPATPSRNSSSNAVEKAVEKAAASMKPPKTEKKELQRFNPDPEAQGAHTHHLKSSRRQEKLLDMWRVLLGKKQQELPENENKNPDESDSTADAKAQQAEADAKRAKQEDLSLITDWFGAIKEQKRQQQQQQQQNASATPPIDKKETLAPPASLIQKYGKCQEVVGRGAFGIVRISHKKAENGAERLFAVKEFRRRPEETEKKYSKRLTAEFCISSSLRHPNIIHTLDLLKDAKGDYCEVMEFCAGGDLYTLVLAAGKLEVVEADCFFKQMMRGVEYLHEMGVAHRDLKPENLLLTTRGALKITDFGNGECFRMAWETDPHMVSGLCGSAPYIAPEEYTDKEFDARAVDVWACGVIYMAMRTGRHLWRVARKSQDEFYARYLEGRKDEEGYAPIESLHRARCRNVIYSILDPNPTRRITASQVLKSEWGREIKLCKAGEEGL